jgi:hypothetical protein
LKNILEEEIPSIPSCTSALSVLHLWFTSSSDGSSFPLENRLVHEEFPELPSLNHLEVHLRSRSGGIHRALERKLLALLTIGQYHAVSPEFLQSYGRQKIAVLRKLDRRLRVPRRQCIQEISTASARIQEVNGPPRKKRRQY